MKTPRCEVCGWPLWLGWRWEYLSPVWPADGWRLCCGACARLYTRSASYLSVRRCAPHRLRKLLGLA